MDELSGLRLPPTQATCPPAARICAPCALLPVIDVAPIAETPSLPRGVYKSLMEPRERGAGRERMKRED